MKTQKLTVTEWEGDDSPEAYEFLRSKIAKANDCGGRVIRLDTYKTVQIDLEA